MQLPNLQEHNSHPLFIYVNQTYYTEGTFNITFEMHLLRNENNLKVDVAKLNSTGLDSV